MTLPPDWQLGRVRALRAAAYRCQHPTGTGVECGRPASLVDLVVEAEGFTLSNLRAVCRRHARRTQA